MEKQKASANAIICSPYHGSLFLPPKEKNYIKSQNYEFVIITSLNVIWHIKSKLWDMLKLKTKSQKYDIKVIISDTIQIYEIKSHNYEIK